MLKSLEEIRFCLKKTSGTNSVEETIFIITCHTRGRSILLLPIHKMGSRSERVKALLTRVFEEQGAIDSVNELRDAAMDAEEDE